MKALIFSAILIAASFLQAKSAESTWSFDKSHSRIGFSVSHMVITDVEGNFKEFDGKITTNGDSFDNAKIEFTAQTASINTENQKRDEHLRSDDFFNAAKFPQLKFVSKSMKKSGKGFKLVGDLTIRDVTKTVTLDVQSNGTIKDPWGNTRAGFKLTGKINRFDFNLKWNNTIETGSLIVGKEVTIIANFEIVKNK